MFINPSRKNKSDYLIGVQQDLVVELNTVHDEVNLGVEGFLVNPFLKKLISKMTAKKIIDKFGFPYMNFLFDSEYNTKTGAMTGEGFEAVEEFSPYEYPKSAKEHKAHIKFKEVIAKLEGVKTERTKKILLIKQEVLEAKGVKLKDLPKYATKRGYILKLEVQGKTYTYKDQVNAKLANIVKSH